MGGSAASPMPYQRVETSEEMPKWKKELFGYTPNAPEYSPFKALSRQAGAQAKMIEGMTSRPTWSSMYAAMGVPQGQDLTPYIQAMRTGTQGPQAPIPQSPAAETIPEYTNPVDTGPRPKEEAPAAAQGGLMSLRKFAKGGTPKAPKEVTWSDAQESRRNDLIAKQQANQKLTQQEKNVLNSLNKNYKGYQTYKDYQTQQAQQTADKAPEPAVPLSQAMNVVTPFFDPSQMYGQYGGITNPIYQQALDQLRGVSKTPEQFQQATGIMGSAASRLMDQSNYTPQQVQAAQAAAAQMSRGTVRDINAIQADVERYRAANMDVPPALQAEQYQASQMQGAQMQGPASWNAPGTVQQYMDPYQQAVIDQSKFEANRQAAQQRNQMRSQATGQKAFGGSRAALQEAEANRNLGYMLEDIQNKGLSQAYQQGLQQFNTAQGQGLQAGQANLQAALTTQQQNQAAINAQRQLYVQQALDAAKTSYGGALTAAQQNQIAQNAAAQFGAQSQNQAYANYAAQQLAAQQANQGMDWNVGNLNTSNQQAANILNAQLAQQAAIQNQQAGLTAQGMNLQALNQAGQMGQGIGSLGSSMWNLQQNIPQMWGAAGQTAQNIAQQAATGAQQTAQNWWGGMGNAYSPVVNMLNNAPGGTKVSNVNQIPS